MQIDAFEALSIAILLSLNLASEIHYSSAVQIIAFLTVFSDFGQEMHPT